MTGFSLASAKFLFGSNSQVRSRGDMFCFKAESSVSSRPQGVMTSRVLWSMSYTFITHGIPNKTCDRQHFSASACSRPILPNLDSDNYRFSNADLIHLDSSCWWEMLHRIIPAQFLFRPKDLLDLPMFGARLFSSLSISVSKWIFRENAYGEAVLYINLENSEDNWVRLSTI